MWWSVLLGALSKGVDKLGPGAYKFLISLGIGFAVGFWISMKFFSPDPEVTVKYVTKVIEKAAPQQEVLIEYIERDAEIQVVETIIEKEVLKYVPVEAEPVACNIPIGSVRVLNDARDGRLREDSVPTAASAYDGEGALPSTVTRRDLILSDAEIAIQYNKVANQLNALIGWIELQQDSLSVN